MFRKIELWVLLLVILLGFVGTIFFGWLVANNINSFQPRFPALSNVAVELVRIPSNLRRLLGADDLLASSNRFGSLAGFVGDPNFDESYLLLSRYDGDLREGVVELVDLRDFSVVHTWNPDIDYFNSLVNDGTKEEFKNINRDIPNNRARLMHPVLDGDGALIFATEFGYLAKIDSCSKKIWIKDDDIYHHSIELDAEGNIWTPTHFSPKTLPVSKVGPTFNDDGIVKTSKDGKILFRKSLTQIFIDNNLGYLLFQIGTHKFNVDPLHLNDIQPVNQDGEFWKKGDVFLSIRNQSMGMLYRPATNDVIWIGVGHTNSQHDIDIIDDKTISMFNNNYKSLVYGSVVEGHNEVVLYDFEKAQYSSYLPNSLVNEDVRTATGGRSEIISNGDLFVDEEDYGRLIYFNRDGSMKWQFINRNSKGNVYTIAWSRILFRQTDIDNVNNFLSGLEVCENDSKDGEETQL